MEQSHAGGRTTQTPSRAETLLENGISEVIGEVAS
jgi:hypothetical protein